MSSSTTTTGPFSLHRAMTLPHAPDIQALLRSVRADVTVLGFVSSSAGGRMIHSSRTSRRVQYATITRGIWGREFAGGGYL